LWDGCVEVFEEFANETFKMHVMLFCTINDFLAYENLLGYIVNGHKACLICEKDTTFKDWNMEQRLYIRHWRFLKGQHLYYRLKKAFNGHQ